MFKNRSFNVKLVKDNLVAGEEPEPRNPVEGVVLAQAYAQIATDTFANIAQTVAVTAVIIYGAKTASNVVNAGLKYLTK